MEYRLAIYKDSGDFRDIYGFSSFSDFKDLEETKLRDIVKFTNSFPNENELLSFLLHTNLISNEDLDGHPTINFYKNKKANPKPLNYGISYQKDANFFSIQYLVSYYSKKLVDLDFMEEFIDKYYDKLSTVPVFSDLYHLRFCYESYRDYHTMPEEANEAMERFIRRFCTNYDKSKEIKISFPRIRELAMFAINFERRKERQKTVSIIEEIEQIKMELKHYQMILKESAINDEQREAYEQKVAGLERSLQGLN